MVNLTSHSKKWSLVDQAEDKEVVPAARVDQADMVVRVVRSQAFRPKAQGPEVLHRAGDQGFN